MAIKGKKRRRSGGPTRRPGGAPRPVVGTKRPPAWYNSPTGAIVAGVVTAGVVALIVFLVVNAVNGSSSGAATASSGQLQSYSASVASLRQGLSSPVIGMVDISGKEPDLSHVSAEAAGWVQSLQQIEGTVSNQPTPASLQPVNSVFADVVAEYQNAASAYVVAAGIPKTEQAQAIAVAKGERLQADALWDTAITLLNQQRVAAGMSPVTTSNPSVQTGGSSGGSGKG